MDPVISDRRIRLFRATDAFALEAYKASRGLAGAAGMGLGDEIRRVAVRSGGALMAASVSSPGGEEEAGHLRRARAALVEGRYYLYLARRLGMLDLRGYRALTVRQDAALRELGELLES